MKFKAIFLLFNGFILFSLLIVLFLPALLLDQQFARVFWSTNWYVLIAFAVMLGGINTLFLRYWRLYELLESEDWDVLLDYLHHQLFERQHFRPHFVRLYIHTAVVRAQPDKITRLEELLRQHRPSLQRRFAVQLGLPTLFANDHQAMENYYGRMREGSKGQRQLWMLWLYGFSLFLQNKLDQAREPLEQVIDMARDPVLIMLTLFTYTVYSKQDENARQRTRQTRDLLVKRVPQKAMLRQLEHKKEDILLLILDKFVRDALDWLYNQPDAAEEAPK